MTCLDLVTLLPLTKFVTKSRIDCTVFDRELSSRSLILLYCCCTSFSGWSAGSACRSDLPDHQQRTVGTLHPRSQTRLLSRVCYHARSIFVTDFFFWRRLAGEPVHRPSAQRANPVLPRLAWRLYVLPSDSNSN